MEPDKTLNTESLDYFKINISEAEKGAKNFGKSFLQLDRTIQRTIIDYDQAIGEISGFAIGIKPAVAIDEQGKGELAQKFKENTDGVSIIGNYMIWEEKVEDVVKQNKDVFPDYDGTDFQKYITEFLSNKDVPNRDYKLGLILGFPKEASELYAKYMDSYESFFRKAFTIIGMGSESGLSIEEIQILKGYVHDGSGPDMQRSNRFRDQHSLEIEKLVKKLDESKEYTDDQIKYICDSRMVITKGLWYMGVVGTDSYSKVPTYVNQVFEISGMNSEISSIREELERIDYKTDYPMAVNAVSKSFADILSNHMLWGVMQEDPGLKVKAEFKSMEEIMFDAISHSKNKWPGDDVEQFEKDFMKGFKTISSAILKSIEDSGGFYMSGNFRDIQVPRDLDWIAREALEILSHAGCDITPILNRLNEISDLSKFTASEVFAFIFPKPVQNDV